MAVVHRIKGSDGQIHRVQAAENANPSDLILLVERQIIQNQPTQERAAVPAPVKRSNLRELADIPLKATEGAVAGVRMISDVFGANNVVSKNLRSVEDYLSALNSAQSKADSQQIAAIMKDAEDKGLGEQVRAGFKAFSVAPVDFLASAAGTAVPTILGGLGAGALKAGAMGVRGAQLGLGAATGAGVTKGAIYEGVKEALANTKMPPDQVEARAQLAQSYNGENLDQILFGTALGGLAATTGIEPKFVPGVSNAIRSRAKEALVTGTKEAIPEFLQGSQEQLAQNLALQREGIDVPTMRGVVGQGTLEGLAGAGLGGGLGAYTQSRANTAIQAQEDAEAKQRQAALTGINAERARQSAMVDEAQQTAQQTQFATDERTADLAGKTQVDAQISAEAAAYQAKQAKVKEGQALVQEGMKDVPYAFAKTDSVAGIQDLLTNFNDYFYFPKKEDGATLRKQLQQQLNATKQAETARKKLSDTDIEYTALADVQDTFQKQFGVTSETELSNVPLTQLTTAMSQLRTEQPSQKDKFVMKKFDLAEQKLQAAIDNHPETLEKLSLAQANKDEVAELRRRSQLIKAREKELALFDNDPMKKAAFEKGPEAWAAYTAQEEAQKQIPDEAFPVYDAMPEATYEEKMAELERARNEEEVADFALEEQFPSPRTPSDAEAVNEPTQQAPAGQKTLFTQFGKPTAAAMRGTADTTGVSQTQLERASESDAVPSLPETADVSEAEAVEAGTLGDAGRTTRATDRGTVPSDTGQPSALTKTLHVPNKNFTAEQLAADETITEPDIEALKKDIANIEETYSELIPLAEKIRNLRKPRLADVTKLNKLTDYLSGYQYFMSRSIGDTYVRPKTKLGELVMLATRLPDKRQLQALKDYVATLETETQAEPAAAPAPQGRSLLDILNTGKELQSYQESKYGKVKRDVNEPTIDDDEEMASRKAKPKTAGKPKDISGKLREESTEPTTPELFAEKVSNWFNPVWYKNAIKNGMVNIVDGNINDTDLSDAVKEKYADAKALFTPDGKSYFFIANITKGNELGVFLHEIGEHKGLDNLIGKDRVKQLANRVRQMAEGKGSAREVAMAKQAIEMAEGQAQNDKEIIAYFGEIAVFNGVRPGAKARPEFGKATGWVTELWNSITSAVKKLNLNPDKVSDKDIVDMLYGAARLELGAVQTTEGQVDQATAEETEILASRARNPALELTPEEAAEREAKGLAVPTAPKQQTAKEEMMGILGTSKGRDELFNRMGNNIVGPLFTPTKKTIAVLGPGQMYNPNTGKMLGSMLAQHSLNANNITKRAVAIGKLIFEENGSALAVADEANVLVLNQDYGNFLDVIQQAEGVSLAVATKKAENAILAPRYKELIRLGEKSVDEFSNERAAEGLAVQKKYATEYNQFRDRYNKIRSNNIDALVDSGQYTRKEAELLMNRLEYVPLYRIKDSEGADGAFMQGLLSANQRQKLQFDTKDFTVGGIMPNIINNQMWLLKQAIFNNTLNALVDEVEFRGDGKQLKIRNPDDKQSISYKRNGELQHFRFDDPNDMALLRAVPVISNTVTRSLKQMGSLLRAGIVLTPAFNYRQIWNDAQRVYIQSGVDTSFMQLLGESIRQQYKNLTEESKEAVELRNRGLVGAIDTNSASASVSVDEILGIKKDYGPITRAVMAMEKIATNSDLAARANVYKFSQDQINPTTGKNFTPSEAALRAQMMLNYQHRGVDPMLRVLLTTLPFVNTHIQSDWRLINAVQGNIPGMTADQGRRKIISQMLKMSLFVAAYAMMNDGDDEYENVSDEVRNRNFMFKIGDLPTLKIPVAPEYLLLKAGIEQMTRKAIDSEFYEDRKLGQAVFSGISNLLLGPSDLTPAFFRPLIENTMNYSLFTGRALVGQSMAGADENLQFNESTSEFSKTLSDYLQKTGFTPIQVSPIKIDNLITGIFGQMGRNALFLGNELSDAISGKERPDLRYDQIPEVSTLFATPVGNQRVTDFYDVYDKIMKATNSYNNLKKNNPERAREYLEENRKLIAARSSAQATKNTLDNLRKQRGQVIANKNMSGEEKRDRIEKIAKRSNELVVGPTKRLRERIE